MKHGHGLQVGVRSTGRHAGTGTRLGEVGVRPDGLEVGIGGGGGDVCVAADGLHLVRPRSVEASVRAGGGGVDHGVDWVGERAAGPWGGSTAGRQGQVSQRTRFLAGKHQDNLPEDFCLFVSLLNV